MKIRPKVFLLLSVVFLALALVEWGVGRFVLLPRFEDIEHDEAVTAMRRIEQGIEQELARLKIVAYEEANWSETYAFVVNRDARYVATNLTQAEFRQLRVSTLAIIGVDGTIAWATDVNSRTGERTPFGLIPGGRMPPEFPWYRHLTDGVATTGLISTPDGVLMASISPILDGTEHGPQRGAVLVGRQLTAAELAVIGRKAQTSVQFAAFGTAKAVGAESGQPRGAKRVVLTDLTTEVYRTFDGIDGHPLMTLQVNVPRTITASARSTVAYATAFTICAAVVVLVILVIALNSLVLTPLDRMTQHAVAIAGGGDLSQRLNVQRSDELGTMAREFDTMVEQLAQSRREVIDHSFQAGVAELARGVLHNVGNAMTPLGVRLAKLQEALRDAPVGDVDLALEELAEAPQDPARQADLEEFLRLASAQMARSIRSALEDSETVSRQTRLVQHALSDQLRASRGSAVLEPVEIPAVIDQSLEIVPDACRERLDIQIDDSVRRIGIVDLARTVVRLVLQNLIINAAESVRAAGLERGALRFSARIVHETGQEHLLLECADTGMGIAPENLDRIFEKGFSTKRTTSNFGIGLHWCATAVAALGGRISASSAGLGRGATLHVQLPLPSREPLLGGSAA